MFNEYRILMDENGDFRLEKAERVALFLKVWVYLKSYQPFYKLTEYAADDANPPKPIVVWQSKIKVK